MDNIKLTKKQRHGIYKKVLNEESYIKNPFGSGLCYTLLENGLGNFLLPSEHAEVIFPEFGLFKPGANKLGIWFDNDEERFQCLLFCIFMTQ